MSSFVNYSQISEGYDRRRKPVGVDVILGAVTRVMGGFPKQATVVDIGCGTGNYAMELSPYVNEIIGVEKSSEMIEKANKKSIENIKMIEGNISDLHKILPKKCCDVVICTLVLHHLEDSAPPDYLGPSKVISDVYGVLNDKGAVIINTMGYHQQAEASAFFKLAPPRVQAIYQSKFPPIDMLCKRLEEVGFKVHSVLPHCHKTECVMKNELHLNIEGPLTKEWLDATSVWSRKLATAEEIKSMQDEWREMMNDGRAQKFLNEIEKARQKIGETTTILAYKGY